MRYHVLVTELAEIEIREYYLAYNRLRDELGDEFKEELNEAIHFLEEEAQTIQIRYNSTRIFFLKRFPFGIHFRIIGDKVTVSGVFPVKANPDKWDERLK